LDEGYEVYVKDARILGRCDTRIKFYEPDGDYCLGLL